MIQVPMIRDSVQNAKGYITYVAPKTFNGLEITRALGRLCSGDTLCIPENNSKVPVMTCETFYSDGTPYLVVTHI